MTTRNIIFVFVVMLMLIAPALATPGNVSASRGITANGPYNLLVPLGIEQVPNVPLATALMWYNWISIMLLFFLISMASQRNMRFFVIIAPMMAALFAYFGWLNDTNTVRLWGLIGLTALVAVGIYLKDTNKEKWGSGGPGWTLVNFVFLMIFLQGAVGVVNTTGIWDHNTVETPSQYQNVDLGNQMNQTSNTGGLSAAVSGADGLIAGGIMALQMVISVILTIAAFSVTLYLVFPWLYGNVIIAALIGVIQVVVWLMYSWFIFTMIWKPASDQGMI